MAASYYKLGTLGAGNTEYLERTLKIWSQLFEECKRKTSQRLVIGTCSVRQYPQHPHLSFRLQGRDVAHWEMVKNGAESACNLQAGTAGEMDLQDYCVPQQWDDCPGLVSGKSGSREKLLLLAAAAV